MALAIQRCTLYVFKEADSSPNPEQHPQVFKSSGSKDRNATAPISRKHEGKRRRGTYCTRMKHVYTYNYSSLPLPDHSRATKSCSMVWNLNIAYVMYEYEAEEQRPRRPASCPLIHLQTFNVSSWRFALPQGFAFHTALSYPALMQG